MNLQGDTNIQTIAHGATVETKSLCDLYWGIPLREEKEWGQKAEMKLYKWRRKVGGGIPRNPTPHHSFKNQRNQLRQKP